MSFIRASTKVPGQKNISRTYAWWDTGGGIIINGRDLSGTNSGTCVLVSIPEFAYMAERFMERFPKSRSARYKWLKRAHRGFFTKYDKLYEKYAAKSHKMFMSVINNKDRSKKVTKRYLKENKALWIEYQQKVKELWEKKYA